MIEPFLEIPSGSFMIAPFKADASEGYIQKLNFPNCCTPHTEIFNGLSTWFEKFPNCCEQHKKLVALPLFRASYYQGTVMKIMECVEYAQHHITEHINDINWYKDITDYIEYLIYSFGTPGIGADRFLRNLGANIDNLGVPTDKSILLKEYIKTQTGPSPSTATPTDLNAVVRTYQKWLKTFPFDLFPFTRIKDHFQNQLPIIQGKIEHNPYSGLAKGKPHTPSSLIDWLCGLTKLILETVNTAEMVKAGEIKDSKKHTLDLIGEKHRLKQNKLLTDYSKGELRYITVLKTWLKNEKSYFEEVTPILKEAESIKSNNKKDHMDIKIPKELKPFAAALKILEIGNFLRTDEFEHLMLEKDLDDLWTNAIKEVHPGDTIFVGNNRVFEDAFFYALEQLWIHHKKVFFDFAEAVVLGFINWVKPGKDLSKLINAVTDLKFHNLDELNNAVKNGQEASASGGTKAPIMKDDLIFVGHGKGTTYLEVEKFLQSRGLPYESFETDSRTGEHIVDILTGFLDRATFAVIVVTADDPTASGTIRGRQNVIHEIGLFQGRLGFKKVAILKQDEAEAFSNNDGLQHIPFPKDNIKAAFYSLEEALKRAGIKQK